MPIPRRALGVAAAITCLAIAAVLVVPFHPESFVLHSLDGLVPNSSRTGFWVVWLAVENLGNIALFAPAGLVLGLLLRPRAALVAGLLLSVCGEAAQLLIPERHASLSDIVLNAVGVLIGLGAALTIRRRSASRRLRRAGSDRP